jgi:predicted transcriptional regulator
MAETTAQEQLINFIHDLTDEECDFLILLLQKQNREQA